MKNQHLKKRILSIALILSGLILGVTWNKESFCIGDKIFASLGLPAWSSGTSGTHYPAVIGTIILLLGISILSSTFSEKARKWIWPSIILLLVVLSLLFSIF